MSRKMMIVTDKSLYFLFSLLPCHIQSFHLVHDPEPHWDIKLETGTTFLWKAKWELGLCIYRMENLKFCNQKQKAKELKPNLSKEDILIYLIINSVLNIKHNIKSKSRQNIYYDL